MSLYTRARKHIDMDRVKELHEEKKRREEIIRQQQLIIAEIKSIDEKLKCVDWRRELEEGMTTDAMGTIYLAPEGNVDIIDTSTTYNNIQSIQNSTISGDTITLQGTENQINDGTHTYFNFARFTVPGTRVSHAKITISKGGGTSSWTDRDGESFDDHVSLNIFDADDEFAPQYYNADLTSGTHIIRLPSNYKNLRIDFSQFGRVGGTGPLRITNVSLQRRTPINVFVSLDDPDANAFVRDGDFNRLSNAEKKKKLEEMLQASGEYLDKMFGDGMPGTATEIADYELQQSFVDMAQGLPYTDSDDAFDDPYYQGPPPDLDDDSDFDLDDFEYAGTNWDLYNWMNKTYGLPAAEWKKNNPTKPDASNPHLPAGSYVPKAKKGNKQKTMVAHHEPEGEVLSEKKRLKSPKSLLDKIPGYYDGKPSPLGFPVEKPPKMVNGYHPDLVDGKKVANRFNKLDPISAKAMPKTGNPKIDAKVDKALKKPK